jgi:Arc/MetJ-type ribon-helix-helix transcriptional regulator
MTALPFTLPTDLAEFVTRAVARGDYPSAEAMVVAALERLRISSAAETKPEMQLPPPVDLTRQGFDGPKFLGDMMHKLWAKK